MTSYLRSLNDEFIQQVAIMCCTSFRPSDPRIVDDSGDTPHTVNSVGSALGVLERGLALNLKHLDIVYSDTDRHSRVIDRMHVVLAHKRDLTNLRRALVLEERAFLAVRRQLVHAFLSAGVHLHFLNVCRARPETSSFTNELAWKQQFDDIIKVVKEELTAANEAFIGIAEEERRLGLH
ncbi:hypothetical protein BDM02DRAFT_3131944 [Thelephora ganbajun]|uniref:Uncharacterized protein n=1 Tax=Thelephora ganbajun TaxID=370292 RepID=A0ACB6Z4S8_THEGA|nr:hypothetical protein BDM02DRAFT_3131944 [Thelephora ganbajun]